MWRVTLLFVLIAGCARGSPPARSGTEPRGQLPVGQTASPVISLTPRRFTQGEVLYIRYCADCHGWTGQGDGPLASLLQDKPRNLRQAELFTRYSETELVARVLYGKDLPLLLSPAVSSYTETEVTALLTHLQRLHALPWEQINAGEKVYDSLCAACHGLYGRGDGRAVSALSVAPRDLTDSSYQSQVSDEELLRIVTAGKGAMPGAADVLSAQELQAVVAFVRLLSPGYELYDRFCAVCHGSDGHPPTSPDRGEVNPLSQKMPTFDRVYFQTHTDEQVRTKIPHVRKKSRAVMPHFAGDLSADEVSQLLAYLRALPPEP